MARYVSAALMILVLGLILAYGNPALVSLLIILIAGLAAYELTGFVKENPTWLKALMFIFTSGLLYHSYLMSKGQGSVVISMIETPAVFLICLWGQFLRPQADNANRFLGFLVSFFGVVATVLLFGKIIMMLTYTYWQEWLIILFLGTYLGDTGGFIFGKAFGKNKISPKISPKKSWQGLFGGMFMSLVGVVVGAGLIHVFNDKPFFEFQRDWVYLFLGPLMALVGFWGDLMFSLAKRGVGIKDSGNIIPGHGGIIDRIDSLYLTAPVMMIFMALVR